MNADEHASRRPATVTNRKKLRSNDWGDASSFTRRHQRPCLRSDYSNSTFLGTCHNNSIVTRPAKITTPFPSVSDTAKRLGVSKREVRALLEMVDRPPKAGEFATLSSDRSIRASRKARMRRNPATGDYKAVKDTGIPSHKR